MALFKVYPAYVDLARERRNLLTRENYIPHDFFLRGTTWFDNASHGIRTLYDEYGTGPKFCSVVGMVTPDHLMMEPHGDFKIPSDPDRASMLLSSACHRFSIVAPDDVGFAQDFNATVKKLAALVDILQVPDKKVTSFVVDDGDGRPRLNFRHRIFRSRIVSFEEMYGLPPELGVYPVDWIYRPYLDALELTHAVNPLALWDKSGQPIDVTQRGDYMVNNVAEVTFTLKFKFSVGLIADVETISIIS